MEYLRFEKGTIPGQVVAAGVVILSLAFIFYQQFLFVALAQEADTAAPPPASEPVQVSDATKASVEEGLEISAEAATESAVNLPQELGLEGYDPLVPTDGFWGRVVYPVKEATWNLQEGIYNTFASDSSYAQLLQDHANKELVAAAEVYADDATKTSQVLGILQEYKEDLGTVKQVIPAVKEEDPTLAKALSATMAADHLFVAPKFLGTIQEAFLAAEPEIVPQLIAIKNDTIKSAGGSIVAAADNEAEITQALNTLASETQATPFSGIIQAEYLSQAKSQLGDEISAAVAGAFDEAIGSQLKVVEANLKNLQASDEVKAESFQKYVAQFPGQSLSRLKVVDQFKSQADMSAVMITRIQEVKAKIAESIAAKIQNLVQDEIRKAVSDAMLEFKNPNVDDFKLLSEFQGLVPQEEIREQIVQNQEKQVQKFLDRFGDDQNARKVTEEFQALMKKVESGQITPDSIFFQTLEGLKSRLNPQQQIFIGEMETRGKTEVFNRLQNDQNFAARFATSNPADLAVFDRFRQEGFGAQFAPAGFDFEAKFRAIEGQQAQNFERFLGFQSRPENVQAIRQQFEAVVPREVRARFEQNYNFRPEEFQKFEQQAREKEVFFQQKFEEMRKEYEAKFGTGGSPPGASPFPGAAPGFPFPGAPSFPPGFPPPFFPPPPGQPPGQPVPPPGYVGPPVDANTAGCPVGQVRGPYGCEWNYQRPPTQPPSCPPEYIATPFGCEPRQVQDPAEYCRLRGGTWTGNICEFGTTTDCPYGKNPDGSCLPPPPPPTTGSCTPELTSLLGSGCHNMGNAWFNGEMNRYVLPGTTTVKDCATASISGCTTGGTTPPPSATSCPSGQYWYVPPEGGAGYCKSNTTTPPPSSPTSPSSGSCPAGYHWMSDNGGWCMADGGTTTTPPPPPTSDPATECARAGGTWTNGYCQMPTTSPPPPPPPTSPPPPPPEPPPPPPPTGYAPYPSVAGVSTRVYQHDVGIFDFLAIFGF